MLRASTIKKAIWGASALVVAIIGVIFFTETVPVGHVGVATMFGKPVDKSYENGFHVVNPLYSFVMYDVRQKSHKETANVPSQDQLMTSVDVSVQYRVNGGMAPTILKQTGSAVDLVNVHLVPKLRSSLREAGKSVENAQEFFQEKVQQRLSAKIKSDLITYLTPFGIEVTDVLLRDFKLPRFILEAVEEKKRREQKAEEQKAELARYKTEQEQKIATAAAERRAAEEQASKIKLLAEAKAYEIEKINDAVKSNPSYIQLEALGTLKEMSKNPATQFYFLDGSSSMPLPLLHLGGENGLSK